MEQTSITVYFGKGEYAITGKNVEKLAKACIEFQATGNWKWCLQDSLGIKADGTFGPRFGQVQTALKDSTDDKVVALLIAMSEVTPKPVTEIKRNMRTVYSAPVAATTSAPAVTPAPVPAPAAEESIEDLLGEMPDAAEA